MVSALASGASGPGSSPGQGHCVVFLGKTLYSHSDSLHPGVQIGTGEFNAGGNPFILLHGERHCESKVSCPKEHNTMSPARARTRTARSGDERTNHEATAPPTSP